MDAGRKYWLTIQAVSDLSWCHEWYWMASDDNWNCDAMWKSDYYGWPDWILIGIPTEALAFCLYSDQSVTTEGETWGAVKVLYR
jgi:hypothetical protein